MASKLNLDVLVNVKGTENLTGLSGKLARTGSTLSKYVTLPLVGAGVAAFKFASDLNESTSKAETVFGKNAGRIKADAENLNDAFSESTFLDTAGTLGAMAQGMGATADETVKFSEGWLQAGEDLASFNNVPIDQSLGAIQSALAGEFEPLKRFGILLNVAKVEAEAVRLGLIKQGETLDDHSRLVATNSLVMESLGAAQGDFDRTSSGAANSMKILAANAIDLAADIGTQLLPIGIQLLTWVKQGITFFQQLPGPVKQVIVPLLGIAAAIGPLLIVGSKLIGAFKAVGAAFQVLRLIMLANPFLALTAAVILIAALIIANWDKILGFLKKVWATIMSAVGGFVDKLVGAFEGLRDSVANIWNAVINIIKGAINGVIDVINGLFGFLNGIQIGIPEINVGPVHVGGGVIDPFNIGLIPHLAQGGIIDSPTLALLGERGPEAVVPLGKSSVGETHFHSHIEVRGEEPFIRDEAGLVRANQRIAFLQGF